MDFERTTQNARRNRNSTTAKPAGESEMSDQTESFDLELAQAMAESEGFSNLPHPDSNLNFKKRSPGNQFQSRLMTARNLALRFSESTQERWRELPADSRELASKINTHARANPWLHIGIASAGGLLLGLAAGRIFSSGKSAQPTPVKGYDFDQAMDE